jgi:hypothetical protein
MPTAWDPCPGNKKAMVFNRVPPLSIILGLLRKRSRKKVIIPVSDDSVELEEFPRQIQGNRLVAMATVFF